MQHNLRMNKLFTNNEDKYLASCVYQLTCLGCCKRYVGQTGRLFPPKI